MTLFPSDMMEGKTRLAVLSEPHFFCNKKQTLVFSHLMTTDQCEEVTSSIIMTCFEKAVVFGMKSCNVLDLTGKFQ